MVESGFFYCCSCAHIKRSDSQAPRSPGQKRRVCVSCVATIQRRVSRRSFGRAYSIGPMATNNLVLIARQFDATPL